MKSRFSARFAYSTLAATLLASYTAFFFGFPLFLSQFVNFKIEISTQTILAINFSRFLASPVGIVTCGILILATGFALARGDKFAWGIGLLISLIFSEAQLCLLLPIMAAANSVGSLSISHPMLQILAILAIALAPPFLFLALRRAFVGTQQPPQTQTSHA